MHIRAAGAAFAILLTVQLVAPTKAAGQRASLAQLGWLAGCLEMRSGDRVVEEQRMAARGGSMLGMARTTIRKELGEYELTLIQEKAGNIIFEAHPSSQAIATFTATFAGPDSVVFAAPEHDYPQIVGYRRSGADSVVAWIDGKAGGQATRIEFPYRRVKCPGQEPSEDRATALPLPAGERRR
jgi:hypothetical protein